MGGSVSIVQTELSSFLLCTQFTINRVINCGKFSVIIRRISDKCDSNCWTL